MVDKNSWENMKWYLTYWNGIVNFVKFMYYVVYLYILISNDVLIWLIYRII